MEDLKKTIAKNIAELRKANRLTQAELAEKLCYSDKAVSKWERGESIPDVIILKQVADMFEVTVDYLLCDHENEKVIPNQKAKKIKRNRILITLISFCLVWLIATATFTILNLSLEKVGGLWLIFIAAIPVSLIVLLVFNAVWGNKKFNFLIVSLLMWSALTLICLSLLKFNIWLIFVIGVPAQVIIVLWSGITKDKKKSTASEKVKKEKAKAEISEESTKE